MSKRILFIAGLSLLLALASCQSEKDRANARIEAMADSLYAAGTGMVNPQVASRLLEECLKYASDYPEDSLAPRYLIEAKNYALYMHDPIRSIGIMEDFLERYPTHQAAPDVLFSLAFVYENYLNDLGKAREHYELFIQTYPDHGKLTQDARFAIDHLGMPADEVLAEILAKQDSVSAE